MRNYYYLFVCAILSAGMFSCSGNDKKESSQEEVQIEEVKEEPVKMVEAVSIWDGISVREEPSADGKWISSVSLGEKVMMTGNTAIDSASDNKKYVEIKLGDDKQGWVVEGFVEEGKAVAALREVQIFKRPDLLTKTEKSFSPMDVLVLMDTKDEWVEVKGKKQGDKWFSSGWVKRTELTDDEVDIAVAVYGQKALAIENEDKRAEAIEEILENTSFTSSQFMADLKEELNDLQNQEEEMLEEPAQKTDSAMQTSEEPETSAEPVE